MSPSKTAFVAVATMNAVVVGVSVLLSQVDPARIVVPHVLEYIAAVAAINLVWMIFGRDS